MMTPDEIKKGLNCNNIDNCNECPYDGLDCAKHVDQDALAYIQELEDRNSKLEYTLLGVMHSVDKWLNVEPYDFDKDDGTVAATRASNAREVALKAIDKLESRLAQVERERDALIRHVQGKCHACKHADGFPNKGLCGSCKHTFHGKRESAENWEWRGIVEENTKEEK